MQVIVHEKLVGAVCSVPCRMAFPPQELLWLFGFESIDIGFPLRYDSEGLPQKPTLCSRILIAQVQYRV